MDILLLPSTSPPSSCFRFRLEPCCITTRHSPPKRNFDTVIRLHAPVSILPLPSQCRYLDSASAAAGTGVSPRVTRVQSTTGDSGTTSTIAGNVFGVLHLVLSLGIILAIDNFLKMAFAAAAIKFPSALFGMFCIFSTLVILDVVFPLLPLAWRNSSSLLLFIQRWLPLFYVPSIVLPLAVKDIPAALVQKLV